MSSWSIENNRLTSFLFNEKFYTFIDRLRKKWHLQLCRYFKLIKGALLC